MRERAGAARPVVKCGVAYLNGIGAVPVVGEASMTPWERRQVSTGNGMGKGKGKLPTSPGRAGRRVSV